MSNILKFILVGIALPVIAPAAVFIDNFSGNTLADTNFQTPPTTAGNVNLFANQANSRLDLLSTGTLTGARNTALLNHRQTAAQTDFWTISSAVHLADASDFSFLSGDIIDLHFRVTNSADSNDNLEYDFAVGDPFGGGATHLVRFGKQTNNVDLDEAFNPSLGTAALTGTISMHYSPLTQLVTASYDFGGGSTFLGSTNIADWGMSSTDNFVFNLEGAAFNVNDQTLDGSFTIDAGEAYFDSFYLATPEPGRAMLLGLAAVGWIMRRRRA